MAKTELGVKIAHQRRWSLQNPWLKLNWGNPSIPYRMDREVSFKLETMNLQDAFLSSSSSPAQSSSLAKDMATLQSPWTQKDHRWRGNWNPTVIVDHCDMSKRGTKKRIKTTNREYLIYWYISEDIYQRKFSLILIYIRENSRFFLPVCHFCFEIPMYCRQIPSTALLTD